MRTIRIFAVPSHQTKERTSGVDFARVIQPMKALNGYSEGDITFQVDFYDINAPKQPNWFEIADAYDLVFLNYTVMDWQYAAMGVCVHGKGKKIIMDLDDAIWNVMPDNIVYAELKRLNAPYKLTCMLNDVDGVVTTTRYLRNVIADKTYKSHDKILVAPNQIDLSLYSHVSPAKEPDTMTLLHYGSTTHFDDLLDEAFLKGMDRIMATYPNVVLKTVGAFVSQLKYKWGERYINAFGDVDIYRWVKNKFPSYMDEADILVVPLQDTIYNRSKSSIKFIEASSAMKPGVFSAVRPYVEDIEDGKTGFLASTADEWYTAISTLIDSREERQRIGQHAYDYVKDNRQMKDNIKPYADFIRKIVGAP